MLISTSCLDSIKYFLPERIARGAVSRPRQAAYETGIMFVLGQTPSPPSLGIHLRITYSTRVVNRSAPWKFQVLFCWAHLLVGYVAFRCISSPGSLDSYIMLSSTSSAHLQPLTALPCLAHAKRLEVLVSFVLIDNVITRILRASSCSQTLSHCESPPL